MGICEGQKIFLLETRGALILLSDWYCRWQAVGRTTAQRFAGIYCIARSHPDWPDLL